MAREFDSVPVWCLVLRLGLPAMLARLFNILYSMVDQIFVGHIAGSGALGLAGIGICAPALSLVWRSAPGLRRELSTVEQSS